MGRREQPFDYGEVADLYDRARPCYPERLIDDVVQFTGMPTPRMLEAGAGTGKATVAFASRGLAIVALEPAPDMAAVASRNCAAFPAVDVVVANFEDWAGPRAGFDLLVAAQSWHWLAPKRRVRRAAELLGLGGTLAVFWNLPLWEDRGLRDELEEVYATHAPGLEAAPVFPRLRGWDVNSMVPEIAASGLFTAVDERSYRWAVIYTTDQFLDLASTHSDHRLLAEAHRSALLGGLAAVLGRRGGAFEMVYEARLYLTRRLPDGDPTLKGARATG